RTAERLFLIGDLKRKYGDSIADVLAYAADAQRRVGEIEHRSERVTELAAHAEGLESELNAAAQALSLRRRAAATTLSDAVCRELGELRFSDARFNVSVEPVSVDITGMD